jgi:hypothetical protein
VIGRDEWGWVLSWAAIVLVIVNIPYLLGWVTSTPEVEFGGAVYNVHDANSYIAKMRQGAQGAWLFRLPYTVEEHRGTIVYIYYLLLGKLAAVSGVSLEWTFHLARLASGALLLTTVYAFLARFTSYRAVRRTAFLLIAFSGGMAWLLSLLGVTHWLDWLPLDLILPEAYVFLTLYSSPHIALAMACILWGLLCLEDLEHLRARLVLIAAAVFTVAALVGGFYLVVPFSILGVHWLVTMLHQRRANWKALGCIALAGLAPALVIGYTYYVFTVDPVYRVWADQNLVLSPHPLHYLAGYAITGSLAVLGVVWTVRAGRWRMQLPVIWLALLPLLVYSPFTLQRRLSIGVQVPLCLLAAIGLIHILVLPFGRSGAVRWLSRLRRYDRRGMRRLAVAAVILLTIPTNLLLLAGNSIKVIQRHAPIYHSRAELDALDWLRANTDAQDAVLCAYETGNYLPARAGNRVLLGLGTETIHAERKRDEVRRFYDPGEADAWRRELLERYEIAYVLVGPNERALGSYDPGEAAFLRRVYVGESTSDHLRHFIYRVEVVP